MASLDWHALGDDNTVHYRKWRVYELAEKVPIAGHQLCGAPFGGPVAVISQVATSEHGPGRSGVGVSEPMELRIYTSAGASMKLLTLRCICVGSEMGGVRAP